MTVKKYKNKPEEVYAIQFTRHNLNEIKEFLSDNFINHSEGRLEFRGVDGIEFCYDYDGDWFIKYDDGDYSSMWDCLFVDRFEGVKDEE